MANGGLYALIREELGDEYCKGIISQLQPDAAAANRINTRMRQYWVDNNRVQGRPCYDYTTLFYAEGATLLDYPVSRFDEPGEDWVRSTFFTDLETATSAADSLPDGLPVCFVSYWSSLRYGLFLYVGTSGLDISDADFYFPGTPFDPTSTGNGE